MGAWRVLVVDDEPDVLASLTHLVGCIEGVSIEAAPTLATAMALLDGKAFDLVISDERLPDGSGLELLRWVGAARPATGLVLVSAFADDAALVRRAINEARVHHVVLKPWDTEAFIARLRALLEEQGRLEARLRAFARAAAELDAEPPRQGQEPWPPS